MDSVVVKLPASATTCDVVFEIDRLNVDGTVHGILLQHPVPAHVDERLCFDKISIRKDVDGVTRYGFGLMALGEPAFGPATPVGAVGKAKFIRSDWIGDGAIVIDAGYHPGPIGDIDLEGLTGRCAAVTPVPGGVGPMTISTLIAQTVVAAEHACTVV